MRSHGSCIFWILCLYHCKWCSPSSSPTTTWRDLRPVLTWQAIATETKGNRRPKVGDSSLCTTEGELERDQSVYFKKKKKTTKEGAFRVVSPFRIKKRSLSDLAWIVWDVQLLIKSSLRPLWFGERVVWCTGSDCNTSWGRRSGKKKTNWTEMEWGRGDLEIWVMSASNKAC